MSGFDTIKDDNNEAVAFADNASFDGTERGGVLAINGQLWIGNTAGAAVDTLPAVKVGTIESTTLDVTYNDPNIKIEIAASAIDVIGGPGVTVTNVGDVFTVNSVVYSDDAVGSTVTSDSGTFTTAAVTMTLPASPAQGERCEFIATNGVIVVQSAGSQVIHIGGDSSSGPGTATGSATGDSLNLIYQASTDDWWSIGSPSGVWVLA